MELLLSGEGFLDALDTLDVLNPGKKGENWMLTWPYRWLSASMRNAVQANIIMESVSARS